MHKKFILIIYFSLIASCHTGNLKTITNLPKQLNEVSGNETLPQSDLIWMLNDGGNPAKLYGVNEKGIIIKELKIDAKNNDWEDLAADQAGNIYIGDFGNNDNARKNLLILKVSNDSLNNTDKIGVERISFSYENQTAFPPKKKQRHFDCEAFFYFKDSLYLFTKSRVDGDFGRTNLYRIPAKKGNHIAKFVSSFNAGLNRDCRITAADISDDGKQVALLTSKSVWLFTHFEGTNFLKGTAKELHFNHSSQKEGVCFKNATTLYITDEKAQGSHSNLYEFKLN